MSNAFERAVQRGDKRLFQDVTARNQSAETDANDDPVLDSHGNIVWSDAVETSVPGEIVYRGTPEFQRRADGIDDEIDVVVWLEDAVGYGEEYGVLYGGLLATDGSESEAQRATRILADGETYVIRDTFMERNGRLRCFGEKED